VWLRPHLVVQAIGLLVSFGYFFLYAWSYFYGDLYTQKKKLVVSYFVERMWLATILLVFSLFQCYLFVTVVKCSMYLNGLKMERNRKANQFEEVSNRVRLAKQNGLWRSTSWGGGFQQYRGQYDKSNAKPKKSKKLSERVQWDLSRNLEKSITSSSSSSRDQDRQRHRSAMATSAVIPTVVQPSMNSNFLHVNSYQYEQKPRGKIIALGSIPKEKRRELERENLMSDSRTSARSMGAGPIVKKISISSKMKP